jgi:hypothetical protein
MENSMDSAFPYLELRFNVRYDTLLHELDLRLHLWADSDTHRLVPAWQEALQRRLQVTDSVSQVIPADDLGGTTVVSLHESVTADSLPPLVVDLMAVVRAAVPADTRLSACFSGFSNEQVSQIGTRAPGWSSILIDTTSLASR